MGIISERIEGKIINVIINSSNLKQASYNTEDKILRVTFNSGSQYDYYDVPWEVFVKFRMAESQGKYFTANIKDGYPFKKV